MKKQNALMLVLAISLLMLSSHAFGGEWAVPSDPFFDHDTVIGLPNLGYDQWRQQNQHTKLSFVLGLFTGLMMDSNPPDFRKEFFRKVGGMTGTQVVDTIDKIYKDYPHVRDKYPTVLVILNILPRYRSGEDPLGKTN